LNSGAGLAPRRFCRARTLQLNFSRALLIGVKNALTFFSGATAWRVPKQHDSTGLDSISAWMMARSRDRAVSFISHPA
jgi:hypothetical protein